MEYNSNKINMYIVFKHIHICVNNALIRHDPDFIL